MIQYAENAIEHLQHQEGEWTVAKDGQEFWRIAKTTSDSLLDTPLDAFECVPLPLHPGCAPKTSTRTPIEKSTLVPQGA